MVDSEGVGLRDINRLQLRSTFPFSCGDRDLM
jgi:hypothetical protein